MSSTRLYWYRRCPADALVQTADLTLEQEGALLRLLDLCWLKGALPNDIDMVTQRIRAGRSKSPMVQGLLERYFKLAPDGWHHDDLDAERAHAETLSVKRAEAGRNGGRSKAEAIAKQLPSDPHTQSDPHTDQPPPRRARKRTAARVADARCLERFQEAWSLYPNHNAVGRARAAWMKLAPDDALVETIKAAISQARASLDWTKDNGQFVPLLANWLRDERWKDEHIAVRSGRGSNGAEVFVINGETIELPTLAEGNDRRRAALCDRFGVKTAGRSREEINTRLRRKLEAACNESAGPIRRMSGADRVEAANPICPNPEIDRYL